MGDAQAPSRGRAPARSRRDLGTCAWAIAIWWPSIMPAAWAAATEAGCIGTTMPGIIAAICCMLLGDMPSDVTTLASPEPEPWEPN